MLSLDHLVVVAPDLAAGEAHVRARLGLPMPTGGRHEGMGTHNRLLRLGEALFLEVIAVDPGAPPPARPRWFGLDDAGRVRADWAAGRRLRGLVARTDDLDGLLAAHPGLLGAAVAVRRGDLSWRFGLRPDGAWPADGAAPCPIQWGPGGNPARAMPDLGARLDGLALDHPRPGEVRALHAALGLADPPRVGAGTPRLTARIATPAGPRTLS